MLTFDTQMEDLSSLLREHLVEMRKFAVLLGSDYLKLTDVITTSKSRQLSRKLLKKQLAGLFDSSPNNYHLIALATIFSSLLDIKNKSMKAYANKSK